MFCYMMRMMMDDVVVVDVVDETGGCWCYKLRLLACAADRYLFVSRVVVSFVLVFVCLCVCFCPDAQLTHECRKICVWYDLQHSRVSLLGSCIYTI